MPASVPPGATAIRTVHPDEQVIREEVVTVELLRIIRSKRAFDRLAFRCVDEIKAALHRVLAVGVFIFGEYLVPVRREHCLRVFFGKLKQEGGSQPFRERRPVSLGERVLSTAAQQEVENMPGSGQKRIRVATDMGPVISAPIAALIGHFKGHVGQIGGYAPPTYAQYTEE